jgi:UDPglucose--hexose-1-phosphate uridylyltransferase
VTRPVGGELRRNPVSGKLAIVAPARAARPADAASSGDRGPARCPFCPGNEALTPPEVDALRPAGGAADGPGWRVRVVPNKYPALAGRHEVIIHAPDHGAELEDLGDEGLAEVLRVWQRRIDAHLTGGAAAVTLIANVGMGSGASLEHPHEQLFATPVVPPLLLDELLEFERYRNRYGGCVLCDQLEAAGERLVLDGEVGAWVPEASRFNGELWLAPAAHDADARAADSEALAPALRRCLVAVKAVAGDAPLNFWLHTAPAELRGPFHWHLEVAPRTAAFAGFELGSDIALVTKDPGEAAAEYRAALPPG